MAAYGNAHYDASADNNCCPQWEVSGPSMRAMRVSEMGWLQKGTGRVVGGCVLPY